MTEVKVEIVGLDELIAKLKYINGKLKPTLTKAMTRAVNYVDSTVPPYPPPPSASTYTRTHNLENSITTEVKSLGTEIVGLIGSNMVYAPYVISEDDQAWMHKGRWWTLQEVVRKASGEIVAIFQVAVRNLLK